MRPAVPDDASAIAAIHNQGIAERQATFETAPRTAADLEPALGGDDPPFLVAETDGRVVGWARLLPYSDRECYAGVQEASIYVDCAPRAVGRRPRSSSALEAEGRERATGSSSACSSWVQP